MPTRSLPPRVSSSDGARPWWREGYALLLLVGVAAGCGRGADTGVDRILNVSYDPTRELYREVNERFAERWRAETGRTLRIEQSHGGSGSQARAVIEGLDADVVTLALGADVDAIVRLGGQIDEEWRDAFPRGSAPYVSTIVFLVREGNPKNIQEWADLARPGVEVVAPNPKTSGAARWSHLAMWGSALERALGPDFAARLRDPSEREAVAAAEAAARAFTASVYANVPVLDAGARAAANTFLQRGIGDVLVSWENEILLASEELDFARVEVVIPEVSILAEPVVAVVDRTVDRRGTREVALAYLDFLYSEEGQEIAARSYYRPNASESVVERTRDRFPALRLFTIEEAFGGWDAANAAHFAEGANFDRIYRP